MYDHHTHNRKLAAAKIMGIKNKYGKYGQTLALCFLHYAFLQLKVARGMRGKYSECSFTTS